MSYILEALRKADQERTVGKVPDLESVHATGQPAVHTNRRLWIVGGLLLFNGILIAVLVLRNGSGTDEEPITSQSVVAKNSAPVATTEPPREAPAVSSHQPLPGRASPPAATPAAENVTAYRPPVKAPSAPRPRARGQVIVADSPLSVQDDTPVIAKDTAKGTGSPAAPVAEVSSGIPEWNDLSLEFRGSFQAPHVDVHVYDTDPQRRFVLIDLQKYREGDQLQSGALLEEILPDGIQLLYQGTQFIYRK